MGIGSGDVLNTHFVAPHESGRWGLSLEEVIGNDVLMDNGDLADDISPRLVGNSIDRASHLIRLINFTRNTHDPPPNL
mgnify:CR=1 FL=1